MFETLLASLSNPAVLGGLVLGLDLLFRKVPKALPVLQIVAKVALVLDGVLSKVPGFKNNDGK